MSAKLVCVAVAFVGAASPVSARAVSFFEFRISGEATGVILPYCPSQQSPSCANARPITEYLPSRVFQASLEEGVNNLDFGQYNASGGQFSFTNVKSGTSLAGADIKYAYQPCGGGRCDAKFLSAKSFNIGVSKGVPEPATWITMILGFGIVGYSLRRRQALKAAVRFI